MLWYSKSPGKKLSISRVTFKIYRTLWGNQGRIWALLRVNSISSTVFLFKTCSLPRLKLNRLKKAKQLRGCTYLVQKLYNRILSIPGHQGDMSRKVVYQVQHLNAIFSLCIVSYTISFLIVFWKQVSYFNPKNQLEAHDLKIPLHTTKITDNITYFLEIVCIKPCTSRKKKTNQKRNIFLLSS